MLRILLVNSERGVAGGLSSAVELATGLASAGHAVSVVCHPASVLRERLAAAGTVEVMPVAIRAELNAWRAVQIATVIERTRPDVILADRRKDVKLSFAARLLRQGPALVHRHGAPSVLRDGLLYRTLWTRIEGMIVNSAAMRTQLLAATPWIAAVPMHVIHNGKDLSRFAPRPELRLAMRQALGIPGSAFVVCYHGVLQPRKNVDLLLRSISLLGEPQVHALLVGPGPERPALEALAGELGLATTFTGPRRDIPELLAAADVAVHLSAAEGFSNAVIEALACGLPVIASRGASHDEQIEDGVSGVLVTAGDTGAVAQNLLLMAHDEAWRRRMAAAARLRAEQQFSLETMVARYGTALAEAKARMRHSR